MSEETTLLHSIIDEQIKRIKSGVEVEFQLSIFEDLKRLTELGVLKVITAYPNDYEIKYDDYDRKLTIYGKVSRMIFEGEAEILRLRSMVSELESKIEELSNN